MSHINPGLLSTYNSLTDKHLSGYFSNTRIRRHLQRAGLITRSGRIVPDKEYKHKLIQRAHQRHVRESLAQAIFHKVLEMERLRQVEIKRKLEEFVRRERVHKMKVERSKRYEEAMIRILSPRPPTRARDLHKQHSGPEEEHSESSESSSSTRPNTAPGKMQRPVRLKPIHSNSTTASLRRSSPYRPHESPPEDEQLFDSAVNKKSRRHLTTMEASHCTYGLPVINNFVTPVPPVTKKKERGVKVTPSSTVRGRRLRPTTSSSGADDPPWLRSSIHQTKVNVNMVYFGKTVHLTNTLMDLKDEVRVFQQHCGGENLCVYKGNLYEGEMFQFISRRHRGFPFSLTFYLNGLQVERLSSCCEFKHRKGPRLGGRHGHFGFSSVEGASPCYKCIIAMGLDKKPTPPPKKGKGDNAQEQSAESPLAAAETETQRTGDDDASHFESETSPTRDPAPARDKVRDDYEEDFEADDEGPVEEATVKEEKSPSPFREIEKLVQEENASETDEDDDEDTMSRSGSSVSSSDQEESDAETVKDSTKDEKAGQPKEDDQEDLAAPANEGEELKSEEAAAAKVEPTFDSAGDSTEFEISDTSAASGGVNKQGDDASEGKNNEEMGHKNKTEDKQERAKSVQEKLAEAILKESQCSSEPELSDTTTEEEEGPAAKDPKQEHKEQEQTVGEETKRVADEVEQEEAPEVKQEGEDEQPQPPDNSQSNKDERVSQVEGDEKAAEDEVTAEGGKSKEPGEARLHVDDENVARDDKTEEPFDGSKPADAESSENDEERVEKVVVLADVHTDGTGQRAKGEEEDESSVLEPSKETDETAEAENAEAEATAASETTEIKAESSEEREALSCEEAPETDAGRRQQADSEDSTAASDAEVTAGNSSGLPGEAADATGERTATKSEEAMNGKGDEDEMEEEAEEDTPETGDHEQEKCELQEEKMEISAEVHDNTEKQTSEEEEQSHLKSEEITEDETLQETEQSKTEEITDERKVDESTDKNENTTENEEEAAKPLDEQNKAVNIENTEEQEKAESPEVSERVEGQRGEKEPEAEGDENSHENVKIIETNVDPEEKDEGAGKTEEAENEDKVTKSEKYGERKDVTEDAPREGEEMSEITEEKEKSEDMDTKKTKICANNIAESEDACDGEAADETKTAEKVQNITDSESDKWKTAGACENEDIDAENGEISFAAESNANKDEEGAPAKEKVGSETAEEVEEEDRKKAEEAAEEESTEVKESREAAAKHEGNVFGAAPDAELTESDAKEGDDGVAKHGESTKEGPELTSDPETKEDPKLDENKGNEETREDENGKKSDLDHQNEALNLIRNDNIERNFSEVALSEGQEKSSSPADDAVKQLGEEKAESAAAVGAELSAADGENGEGAEEASKASEEGASVLLKPSTRNSVAEQSVTVREDTPGALANGDNTDLVTNWINMHQSSRYFETFVEPLEDLREDVFDVKVSNSDREDRPPTELPTSEMRRVIGDDEESRDKTQTETKNLEHLQDDRYDPAKGEEKAEVNLLASSKKTDQSGHGGAVEEERAQAGAVKETHEESRFSKSEVESFSVSLKAESVFENQSGEKVTNIGSDLSAKEASADLSLKTKELRQSESPGVLSDAGEADNQMRQVTQRATIDGSHEEPRGEDAWSEMFEESFGGETRDMQLIQDITQTFSKDHLSSFSVDRAPFGHTSYPLLTTSSAESGQ
ncbi:glutamate-rich protein 3 isoform X2 [Kryptolebias marmoratus]|uniref:glutamate-rich protein 3 isoform X2 n=1 Tax=Kryptolebias marmoratus TaxID=37003 RepID=UPI000D52F428|nr:glutamate-rich protein 3 isoform X2 [Kryptolebias marmoratus]